MSGPDGDDCAACKNVSDDDRAAMMHAITIFQAAKTIFSLGAPVFHAESAPMRRVVAEILTQDLTAVAEGVESLLANRFLMAHGDPPIGPQPKAPYQLAVVTKDQPDGLVTVSVTMRFSQQEPACPSRLP